MTHRLKILVELILCCLLIAIGTWSLYGPIVKTGFGKIPGDLGDARFVHLFLEHNYRYFFTSESLSFWSPTWIFYPLADGLATSDVMTGSAWLYGIFRLIGADAYLAFQSWLITCSIFNFLALYWLLRRWQLGLVGRLAAAFIYAYGLYRIAFNSHPQLTASFYTPLFILCVDVFVREVLPQRQKALALLAAVLLALQLWASFYLGWFTVLALLVGVIALITNKLRRQELAAFIRQRWGIIVTATGVCALLVAPLAFQYLKIARQSGVRVWPGDMMPYLPDWRSLILPIPDGLLYGRYFPLLQGGTQFYTEKVEFVGVIALLAPFVLLGLRRWRPATFHSLPGINGRTISLLLALWFGLTLLSLRFPGSNSLWILPTYFIPGAKGIRAVGRIVHISLIAKLSCLAVVLTMLSRWRRPWGQALTCAALIIVVAENLADSDWAFPVAGQKERMAELVHTIQAQQPPCQAFFLAASGPQHVVNIDAMWSSLLTHIPTINGYTGAYPEQIRSLGLDHPADLTPEALSHWTNHQGLGDKRICFLR